MIIFSDLTASNPDTSSLKCSLILINALLSLSDSLHKKRAFALSIQAFFIPKDGTITVNAMPKLFSLFVTKL